jgi:hypothetical protein
VDDARPCSKVSSTRTRLLDGELYMYPVMMCDRFWSLVGLAGFGAWRFESVAYHLCWTRCVWNSGLSIGGLGCWN